MSQSVLGGPQGPHRTVSNLLRQIIYVLSDLRLQLQLRVWSKKRKTSSFERVSKCQHTVDDLPVPSCLRVLWRVENQ